MKEIVEIRLPEEWARENLGPIGKTLGQLTRSLKVDTNDPLFHRLKNKLRQQKKAAPIGMSAWFRRVYTPEELARAELFRLNINSVFEPAGEECGTAYDASGACPQCGAGRRQISDLVLDLRKVSRTKDIARSIADEWIVSQRLAQLLAETGMSGFELRRVRHKARYQDDPLELNRFSIGRQILRKAETERAPYPSWQFWVWLNRPEQQELLVRLRKQQAATSLSREGLLKELPIWYQVLVTSEPLPTVGPTRFGIHPFDEDEEGRYRCPLGHVSGLSVLSEVWVRREVFAGNDINSTKELIGLRQGLLVPSPVLLISPRLRQLLLANNIRGYDVEVAYLA
jgi:hypothetical protein